MPYTTESGGTGFRKAAPVKALPPSFSRHKNLRSAAVVEPVQVSWRAAEPRVLLACQHQAQPALLQPLCGLPDEQENKHSCSCGQQHLSLWWAHAWPRPVPPASRDDVTVISSRPHVPCRQCICISSGSWVSFALSQPAGLQVACRQGVQKALLRRAVRRAHHGAVHM